MLWTSIAIFSLAFGHHLLLRSSLFQFAQPLLFGRVNKVVIATPVGVIILELRHGHPLPEPNLLLRRNAGDTPVPALLVLVVLAPKLPQALVGRRGVRLHLPDLLAQPGVLPAGLVELCAVGPMPRGDVRDVLGLVLVELLEHHSEGVGVLGEERRILVAAVLGLLERLGEEGYLGVEVFLLACAG